MRYSLSCSYLICLPRRSLVRRRAHNRDEQIGDAGCAHVAECSELSAIDIFEKHDAATEHLALVDRLERLRSGDMVRVHHHFHIARLEFFHAALESDAPAVDEHEIG